MLETDAPIGYRRRGRNAFEDIRRRVAASRRASRVVLECCQANRRRGLVEAYGRAGRMPSRGRCGDLGRTAYYRTMRIPPPSCRPADGRPRSPRYALVAVISRRCRAHFGPGSVRARSARRFGSNWTMREAGSRGRGAREKYGSRDPTPQLLYRSLNSGTCRNHRVGAHRSMRPASSVPCSANCAG